MVTVIYSKLYTITLSLINSSINQIFVVLSFKLVLNIIKYRVVQLLC